MFKIFFLQFSRIWKKMIENKKISIGVREGGRGSTAPRLEVIRPNMECNRANLKIFGQP